MNVLVLCDSKYDCDKLAAQQMVEALKKEGELTVEFCYVNDLDSQKFSDCKALVCEAPQTKKSNNAQVDTTRTNRKIETEEPMYLRRV